MKEQKLFSIKYASRYTGLAPYLIRAWEKRYQAVAPKRSKSNRRIFGLKDIRRLQLLGNAVNAGHPISQISSLSADELIAITNSGAARKKNGTDKSKAVGTTAQAVYQAALRAVFQLDAKQLDDILSDAAVQLTRLELICDVVLKLHRELQRHLQNGRLGQIHLNMTQTVTRFLVWDMLRTVVVSQSAPKIVIATPAGQQFEIDALALALLSAESGWEPFYFGPNLPAEEISRAVEFSKARAVALSINRVDDSRPVIAELRKLRHCLNQDIDILVSGNIKMIADGLPKSGLIFAKKLDDFRSLIESLPLSS